MWLKIAAQGLNSRAVDTDAAIAWQLLDANAAHNTIAMDCMRCFTELQRDVGDQFFRRSLVRNVCSMIEVRLFEMSCAILSNHEAIPEILKHADENDRAEIEQCFDSALTPAEALALKEESPWVDRTGVVKLRPAFSDLCVRFRLVTSLFVRMLRLNPGIDYETEGWRAVKEMVIVRHRLVHPKSHEGTLVTDAELKKTSLAASWTAAALNELIELAAARAKKPGEVIHAINASLRQETQRLLENIQELKESLQNRPDAQIQGE
jgi:hypothetical protein